MPVRLIGVGADIGITARDPQRLAAFYQDFLGLPLAQHLEWPENGAQVWFFAVGDGHLKVLGFDRVPEAANPPGGNQAATGFRYVALLVEALDEALKGLEDAGGRMQRAPARHGGSYVAFIEDPEGNTIELVERLDGDRRSA
jgi:catechol 2,3-dioxygenase-like lactoylglutathione lyase family enzyme